MDLLWGFLNQNLSGFSDLPQWLQVAIPAAICGVLLITFMALGPILYVYVETKVAGFMQDRIGPKRVGPHGLLQTVADGLKLMFKEAIYPAGADKKERGAIRTIPPYNATRMSQTGHSRILWGSMVIFAVIAALRETFLAARCATR